MKPRLVVLGSREYHIDDLVPEFKQHFTYSVRGGGLGFAPGFSLLTMQVLDAQNRQEALQKLPQDVVANGPIDAFMIRVGTDAFEPFDEALLSPLAPHCKIIVSASAGYNEFDVAWMTANGMYFCNTLDAVSEPTADMAMFLTLAVLRDAYRAERSARAGTWKAAAGVPTRDPSGSVLGVIGMGSIGKHLARKAAVFNMRVVYHNRRRLDAETEARCGAATYVGLDDLLRQADVVSVNCPLNDDTRHLLSTREFDLMDGACLVNAARGAIVDEEALITALESGKVARAGLDAFAAEPVIHDYFRASDRVVLQPHMGAATVEAFRRSERECLDNLVEYFATGRPRAPVNDVPV